MKKNGFNVPGTVEINSESTSGIADNLSYPVIIEPIDSFGSKGVTFIYGNGEFDSARDFAMNIQEMEF